MPHNPEKIKRYLAEIIFEIKIENESWNFVLPTLEYSYYDPP